MVQIRSTTSTCAVGYESHQRKLVDGSDPFYLSRRLRFLNPTNGSWWFVQVQTIHLTLSHFLESCSSTGTNINSVDLNHPPTSVGGISESHVLLRSTERI